MTKNTEDWETRFEKQFCYHDAGLELDWDIGIELNGKNRLGELKSFIASEIQKAREEVIDEAIKVIQKLEDRYFPYDAKEISKPLIRNLDNLKTPPKEEK